VIIAVTASTIGAQVETIHAAGAIDVLGKPFDINVLFRKMTEHLGIRFRYDEAASESPGEQDLSAAPVPLAALPAALLAGLLAAVARGDQARIRSLLDEAAGHDAKAAAGLRALAEQYDYDRLTGFISREINKS
jgi:CheY-like chemotaxis protein